MAKKNQGTGGPVAGSRMRCMAGAPLAASVRSKWSGGNAPGRQSHLVVRFPLPDVAYLVLGSGPDGCTIAQVCLGSPIEGVLAPGRSIPKSPPKMC